MSKKTSIECEACDRGYRLAKDGLHYDDDRGGATWGICRKVVARQAEKTRDRKTDSGHIYHSYGGGTFGED